MFGKVFKRKCLSICKYIGKKHGPRHSFHESLARGWLREKNADMVLLVEQLAWRQHQRDASPCTLLSKMSQLCADEARTSQGKSLSAKQGQESIQIPFPSCCETPR